MEIIQNWEAPARTNRHNVTGEAIAKCFDYTLHVRITDILAWRNSGLQDAILAGYLNAIELPLTIDPSALRREITRAFKKHFPTFSNVCDINAVGRHRYVEFYTCMDTNELFKSMCDVTKGCKRINANVEELMQFLGVGTETEVARQ